VQKKDISPNSNMLWVEECDLQEMDFSVVVESIDRFLHQYLDLADVLCHTTAVILVSANRTLIKSIPM